VPSIHPDRLLFEDQHLLIVNKRAGELVVAAEGEGKLPLFDYLKKDYPGLRVVHRLDFGTSGVLVFAKTAAALEQIRKTKFAGWRKTYRAIVGGMMQKKELTIDKPLRARTHEAMVNAVTHVKPLEIFVVATYVEARIDTGRKHQIRKHLASIGHPLVCDPEYGDPKKDRGFRQVCHQRKFLLHAYSLDFPHPMLGAPIHAEAPLPQPFEDALKKLRGER
jgi:RluA family pseudouridine synthase